MIWFDTYQCSCKSLRFLWECSGDDDGDDGGDDDDDDDDDDDGDDNDDDDDDDDVVFVFALIFKSLQNSQNQGEQLSLTAHTRTARSCKLGPLKV